MEPITYRFGDFSVDLPRMALSRNGQPLLVEPKAFDVLCVLIEHRDRLVTKDELLDAVWKDTFVTPNVLTRVVAQLRKALGDDAQEARYIETVTKRGYRFIAAITIEASSETPVGVRATSPASIPAQIAKFTSSTAFTGVAMLFAIVLLVALAIRGGTRPEALGSSGPSLISQRVTTRNANDTAPAISPDGRAIVYVSDRTGQLELYVVGLAPGSQDLALTNDGGQNIDPAWSPDGQLIAFHSMNRGGIWVIPSTGGVPRQVIDSGSKPAWSPDGQSIAFASSHGGHSTLNVIGTDGTGLRRLTEPGSPVGGHLSPSWSNDGRFVTFTRSNGLITDGIWMVNAATGDPQLLAAKPWVGEPHFAPDNRHVYFSSTTPSGSTRLYRVPVDLSKAAATGPAVEVMPFEGGHVQGLSIARDGTMAFGLQSSDANLWAIDLSADGAAGEPRRVTDDVVRAGRPEYSPAGRVAFVQMGSGRPLSTWVMDEDGTDRAPLVTDGPSGNPSWGTDARVLVLRGKLDVDPTLWWVDVATRRGTEISEVSTSGIRSPRVSPNGNEMAFWMIEANGKANVWTQSLDGRRERRRVTHDPEGVNFPAWSPDGSRLAVEVKRGDRTNIAVVSKDGGPLEMITDEPEENWSYSWSPDGIRIAYAGLRKGVWNVYEVSTRTKVSRQLTHFTSASGYVRYPAWSPKGNRIIFEREIRSAGIWTVKLGTASR